MNQTVTMTVPVRLQHMVEVFIEIHQQKHTGAVWVNMGQGTPTNVEIPRTPQRIVLDNRAHNAHR